MMHTQNKMWRVCWDQSRPAWPLQQLSPWRQKIHERWASGKWRKQHYCDFMGPDHFVFLASYSKQARGLRQRESEKGLQTREAELVENGSEGWGAPGAPATFIPPGRGLKNSSLEKMDKLRGKTSIYRHVCVCVCEVPRKEPAQKSVLPKESSSANYPSHACRTFNLVFKLSISVLVPYCQI